MAALVSVADFQSYLNITFSGGDLAQAEAVLDGVSELARGVSGQPWPDAPVGVPGDVKQVVKLASKRHLDLLKKDSTVKSEGMGPFSAAYFDNPEDHFTRGELGILQRFRTKSGLFTIGTSRGETASYESWWYEDNPFLPEYVDQFHSPPPILW